MWYYSWAGQRVFEEVEYPPAAQLFDKTATAGYNRQSTQDE